MSDNLKAAREAMAAWEDETRREGFTEPPDAKHLRAAIAAYDELRLASVERRMAIENLHNVSKDKQKRIYELEADLAALRIEHEAHAALLTVTRGERDRLRPRHREAYEAGRKAGIEEAARVCDDRATIREDAAEEMHKAGSYSDATTYRTYAAAERALAGTLRGLATKPP